MNCFPKQLCFRKIEENIFEQKQKYEKTKPYQLNKPSF